MSTQGLIKFDGNVTRVHTDGLYHIKLDNRVEVHGKLCGDTHHDRTRVVTGDRVTVGLSPYDLTRGLILSRYD
jgi:translation initiation factor IF-1